MWKSPQVLCGQDAWDLVLGTPAPARRLLRRNDMNAWLGIERCFGWLLQTSWQAAVLAGAYPARSIPVAEAALAGLAARALVPAADPFADADDAQQRGEHLQFSETTATAGDARFGSVGAPDAGRPGAGQTRLAATGEPRAAPFPHRRLGAKQSQNQVRPCRWPPRRRLRLSPCRPNHWTGWPSRHRFGWRADWCSRCVSSGPTTDLAGDWRVACRCRMKPFGRFFTECARVVGRQGRGGGH